LFLREFLLLWKWSGFSGELIKLNPRYELQLEVLKQYGINIRSFTQGEKLNLMPYVIMPEEQNLQMQVTRLLKAGKYYQ
jgi:hypothetical protein